MVIYNKEYIKQDGRKLVANGPRDHQRRAATYQQEIMMLKEQLLVVQSQPQPQLSSSNTSVHSMTQEQIDDIVNRTAEDVYIEVENKYSEKVLNLQNDNVSKQKDIDALREEIKRLNSKLDAKDDMIINLTTKISEISSRPVTVVSSGVIGNPEIPKGTISFRPTMDKVYIDPSKKGAEDEMTSHVKIKEVKSEGGDNLGSSVNKLKNLMGKLPKK